MYIPKDKVIWEPTFVLRLFLYVYRFIVMARVGDVECGEESDT